MGLRRPMAMQRREMYSSSFPVFAMFWHVLIFQWQSADLMKVHRGVHTAKENAKGLQKIGEHLGNEHAIQGQSSQGVQNDALLDLLQITHDHVDTPKPEQAAAVQQQSGGHKSSKLWPRVHRTFEEFEDTFIELVDWVRRSADGTSSVGLYLSLGGPRCS